jgi:hypothetical protein
VGSSTAAAAPGQHRSARWVLRGRFPAWGLRASGHRALVLSDTYTPDDLHRSRLTTRTSSQMYRSAARILQGGARRSPRSARCWPLRPRRRRRLFNGMPLFRCITSVIGHKHGTGTVRPISPRYGRSHRCPLLVPGLVHSAGALVSLQVTACVGGPGPGRGAEPARRPKAPI